MTPLAAEEELQVPGCYPYGVRARGSERSRHMRGGFVLWSIEKVAMLGWQRLDGRHRLTSGGQRRNPSMGTFSMDHRTKPPRIWRLLSDHMARTPYG